MEKLQEMNAEMAKHCTPIPGTKVSLYKSTEAPGYLLAHVEPDYIGIIVTSGGAPIVYPDRISAIHQALTHWKQD